MKLNKAEYLIEPNPETPGTFAMRMNDSNNCARPNWKPLKNGAITTLWDMLFRAPGRIEKVKIIVTYKKDDA